MFRIRAAVEEDNNALLALEAASPQGTGIAVNIDRDTYFYRSRLFDEGRVLIGEEDGRLIGVMAYALKDVYIAGELTRAAYFYDLRGEADYRRSMKRGLFRMWKALQEEVRAAGAEFLYGHVKADNVDSMRVSIKSGAQAAAGSSILTLPTLAGGGRSEPPACLEPEAGARRVEEAVGERDMRPARLTDIYSRGAEMGYLKGVYRLHEGRSSAQITVWDTSSIYRGLVYRMPLWLHVLGGVLNPLARRFPLPRIPTVGQRIAYWQLFDALSDGPKGEALLKRLIQWVRHEGHDQGIDITMLFHYNDDPAVSIPRFVPSKRLGYRTMVKPYGEAFPSTPLYLDIRDV